MPAGTYPVRVDVTRSAQVTRAAAAYGVAAEQAGQSILSSSTTSMHRIWLRGQWPVP